MQNYGVITYISISFTYFRDHKRAIEMRKNNVVRVHVI